jgi:hypothetical protein
MEGNDEDEDVKLARASAGLLADLELSLPKVLWKKPAQNHTTHGRVHSRVRQKDLDYIINLVCSTSYTAIQSHSSRLAIDRTLPRRASPSRYEIESIIATYR